MLKPAMVNGRNRVITLNQCVASAQRPLGPRPLISRGLGRLLALPLDCGRRYSSARVRAAGLILALSAGRKPRMQASLFMMARILTMLACLILVPLAALFGTALPDVIREKLSGPAPRAAARLGQAASPVKSNPQRPESPTRSSPFVPSKPADPPPPAASRQPVGNPPAANLPVGNPPSGDASQSDGLLVLLQRLQQLGALHYRLERSPQAGGQYWFRCDVAGSREPFVATDSDPIRTTERVVRQVEAWQASKIR